MVINMSLQPLKTACFLLFYECSSAVWYGLDQLDMWLYKHKCKIIAQIMSKNFLIVLLYTVFNLK